MKLISDTYQDRRIVVEFTEREFDYIRRLVGDTPSTYPQPYFNNGDEPWQFYNKLNAISEEKDYEEAVSFDIRVKRTSSI